MTRMYADLIALFAKWMRWMQLQLYRFISVGVTTKTVVTRTDKRQHDAD